jgi:hypothetical protein
LLVINDPPCLTKRPSTSKIYRSSLDPRRFSVVDKHDIPTTEANCSVEDPMQIFSVFA